jgi:hypothetical protein
MKVRIESIDMSIGFEDRVQEIEIELSSGKKIKLIDSEGHFWGALSEIIQSGKEFEEEELNDLLMVELL